MMKRAILCVDDEKNLLTSLKRLLRKEDYKVHAAESGPEGLELLMEHPVQVVLTDQRMPGMTGVEFLQKVKDMYPDTIRVVLSGYADAYMIVESINEGEVYRFLGKPWNDDELKAVIRQCFEHYDILKQNVELIERTRVQNEQLHTLNENLEQMVEERTMSLKLSQDVLENLPIPVVGVSQEGIIVLINEAARCLSTPLGQIYPGSEIGDAVPTETADVIMKHLVNGTADGIYRHDWDGMRMRVHVKTLVQGDTMRGCLVMLEEEQK
jgi:response regulator RpfG family c-di-GMP phosphodiesterase